jgi:hypothetical protein
MKQRSRHFTYSVLMTTGGQLMCQRFQMGSEGDAPGWEDFPTQQELLNIQRINLRPGAFLCAVSPQGCVPFGALCASRGGQIKGHCRDFFHSSVELGDLLAVFQKQARRHVAARVDDAIHLLNHRPRKCIGYRTPHEVFYGLEMRPLN